MNGGRDLISSAVVPAFNDQYSEEAFVDINLGCIELNEGENTITVIAKDSLGKTTTVTRHVTVDTKAPVISDVEAEATTVDANSTIHLTFKVVDPADA